MPHDSLPSSFAGSCAICRRRSYGLGYAPRRTPMIWACRDPLCASLLNKVSEMPQAQFDEIEIAAMRAAGNVAGEFLDRLGKTDLASLSRDEWEEFLGLVIIGFGEDIKRQLGSDEAPF